jgi:hypothetical protein
MYSSTHSLTSALDGGEWSASRLGRFTPKERAPGTRWIGGWVGPRAILDAVMIVIKMLRESKAYKKFCEEFICTYLQCESKCNLMEHSNLCSYTVFLNRFSNVKVVE